MTLWTTNTWGAAHQNAAVFMRNRGPLARAPQRVMRRKRKAVVTHTVCGATAEDGAASPPDRAQPPLPSPLTHLSPLQGQCSTKFLSPPPFLCLSGPDYIPVATWGLNPWFDHSSAPTHLSEGGKERRVDRDPGILICCSSRTQASGLPSPHCFCVVSPQRSRHLGPSLFPLLPLPNRLPWIQLSRLPALCLSPKCLGWVSNSPRSPCRGPGQVQAILPQLRLLVLA